jgi:hypothetical protein
MFDFKHLTCFVKPFLEQVNVARGYRQGYEHLLQGLAWPVSLTSRAFSRISPPPTCDLGACLHGCLTLTMALCSSCCRVYHPSVADATGLGSTEIASIGFHMSTERLDIGGEQRGYFDWQWKPVRSWPNRFRCFGVDRLGSVHHRTPKVVLCLAPGLSLARLILACL